MGDIEALGVLRIIRGLRAGRFVLAHLIQTLGVMVEHHTHEKMSIFSLFDDVGFVKISQRF